jgi:muramidase (phage lysozyme)
MGSMKPGPIGITDDSPGTNVTGVHQHFRRPGPIGMNLTDTASSAKLEKGKGLKNKRLEENKALLENKNVKAFLAAISAAEGGGYDFKYGAVKGKKDDKWRFSDFSTHPGAGFNGKITAAGLYQINRDTWKEMGGKMGLSDFSPMTQDLIAVEILRTIGAIDNIESGDVSSALSHASRRWSSLPQGAGMAGRYPPQPYMNYDDFVGTYKTNGGSTK